MGHLPLTVTCGAGLGLTAFGGSAAMAFGACVEFVETNLCFRAASGVFEIDLQIVTQIVSALCAAAGALAAAATKGLLEEIIKNAASGAAKHITKYFKGIMESAPPGR